MGSLSNRFLTGLVLVILVSSLSLQYAMVKAETPSSNSVILGNPEANIIIQSPLSKTYNQNNITLAHTIESSVPPQELFQGRLYDYFIRHGVALDYDTNELVNLINNTNLLNQFPDNPSVALSKIGNDLYGGNVTLTELSKGEHSITVWLRTEQDYISYGIPIGCAFSTVSFYVDSTIPTNDQSVSPSPSPTQTLMSSQSPSPTPTVPELSWLIILPLLLSLFSVAVIVRRRKTTK